MAKLAILMLLAVVVAIFANAVSSFPFPDDDDRIQRDFDRFSESFKDGASDTFDSVYGGRCVTQDDCSPISYCRRTSDLQPVGTCQLTWWIILAAILLVVLLTAACCACICCPCCLLYSCCESFCCCC